MNKQTMITVQNVFKTFTLHQQGGVVITALENISFEADKGECLALNGPSGAGKSTLLRCLYGNYLVSRGSIVINHQNEEVNIVTASTRKIVEVRQTTISYVSQFLKVIPRVPALDIVAEPLINDGSPKEYALKQAGELLNRLHIPRRLWSLAPATFSGGEQQRVNIARGFISPKPILLLDEPTASLDSRNRKVVQKLIEEAKANQTAVIGIFHDAEIRSQVADREFALPSPAVNN